MVTRMKLRLGSVDGLVRVGYATDWQQHTSIQLFAEVLFGPDFQTLCARTVLVDKNRFIAMFVQVKEAASLTGRGAGRRH